MNEKRLCYTAILENKREAIKRHTCWLSVDLNSILLIVVLLSYVIAAVTLLLSEVELITTD